MSNRMIEQGRDKLAIIGIENWGAGRFSKYGKLIKPTQAPMRPPQKFCFPMILPVGMPL